MTTFYKPPGKVKLKSKKKRTESSRRWLLRQLNDPYVHKAKKEGYRSRAAFKLEEINAKYKLIKRGQTVVDLGAAPGGWVQLALKLVGPQGHVVGLDLQEIEPIPGSILVQGDFTDDAILAQLKAHIHSGVDVVLSDMAAPACGMSDVDHLRIMHLLELVFLFCQEVLKPGGHMVAKVLRGGTEAALLSQLKQRFAKVSHFKPASSRQDSAEMYVVAQGFRG
jgi:23S rRNA (uridine2552-2'-O)-methyltransferase